MLLQALCIISKPLVKWNWSYSPEALNSGQNLWLFVTCDLEFWQMIVKNNRAPLLSWFKLFALFHSHRWIQTKVNAQGEMLNLGLNRRFFVLCDLQIWRMTLKNNRASLLCCFQLYVSFHSYWWIQPGVTVQKRLFVSKSEIFCLVWPWNLREDLEKQ